MNTAIQPRKETLPELMLKVEELAELAVTAQDDDELAVVGEVLAATQEVEIPRKLDGFCWYLDKVEAEKSALRQMADEMGTAIAALDRKAKRVRDLLEYCVTRAGGKIEGNIHTARLQKAPDELYYDIRTLPLEYIRILPPKMLIDKPQLRRDLQMKVRVPGAGLIASDKVLHIGLNTREREERK